MSTSTSKPLKPKRGTTAQNNAYTGEAYEVTLDTDKKTLVCHDGLTAGGFPLAKEEEVSSLRALIAEEVAKCLKLSGGTLTGVVRQSAGDIMTAARDDMWTSIKGGSEHNHGASLILYGQDHGGNGHAKLLAYKEGVGDATLDLSPDGRANINGNTVLTSAGGTMNGAFVNATLTRNNLSGQTEIYGGTTGSNGAYIALYGQSCPDGYGSGKLLLRAANKGTVTDVTIDPGVGMCVDGKKVMYLTASWQSGNNWYRKYSDGWIEQGGLFTQTGAWATVNLHTPFTQTNYIITTGSIQYSDGGNGYAVIRAGNKTTSSFQCADKWDTGQYKTGKMYWFACGY